MQINRPIVLSALAFSTESFFPINNSSDERRLIGMFSKKGKKQKKED